MVKSAASPFLQTEKAERTNISHVHTTQFHSINWIDPKYLIGRTQSWPSRFKKPAWWQCIHFSLDNTGVILPNLPLKSVVSQGSGGCGVIFILIIQCFWTTSPDILNNEDFIEHHPPHRPPPLSSQICVSTTVAHPFPSGPSQKNWLAREFKYQHLVRPGLPHLRIPYSVGRFQISCSQHLNNAPCSFLSYCLILLYQSPSHLFLSASPGS